MRRVRERGKAALSWTLGFLACCLVLLTSCRFPGSVPGTVKIGLSAPFEGAYRDTGYEALHAVRLAVRQRNEAGGVGGRYLLELVALNDFGEPEEAVRQAREMAVDPGVVAVLGGLLPPLPDVAAPEYGRLDLVFVAPPFEATRLGEVAARLAAGYWKPAPRTAAVLVGRSDWDADCAEAFRRAFAGSGTVVGQGAPPEGTPLGQWLASLAPAPDLLFLAADALTAGEWSARAREAGFGGRILGGPGLGNPLAVKIAGVAAEGVVFASPYPAQALDPSFVTAYKGLSGGAEPGPLAGWSYQMANRLLDAMDSALREDGAAPRAAVVRWWRSRPLPVSGVAAYVISQGAAVAIPGY